MPAVSEQSAAFRKPPPTERADKREPRRTYSSIVTESARTRARLQGFGIRNVALIIALPLSA